jgi:hypothetical protein
MAKIPFPFPPLPEDELSPGPARLEAVREDAQVIRWFIEDRWERKVKESSPLGKMLSIAKFDPNAETPAIETLPQDWVHHNIHVVGALWRLASAIRAVKFTSRCVAFVPVTSSLGRPSETPGNVIPERRNTRRPPTPPRRPP